jgi:hypothetical protein
LEFRRLLRSEPFFADLPVADPAMFSLQDRVDLLHRTGVVGNVQLQIVEMTGVPGDVWLIDLRMLDVGSPNASERPHMMLTFATSARICRAKWRTPAAGVEVRAQLQSYAFFDTLP